MQQVVGVAILAGDKVLGARRTQPAEVAGGWEFPGGKIDPGESPMGAAVREISEELGCVITVRDWLPGATSINGSLELVVCTASLDTGDPTSDEHDQLRWLGIDELDDVGWLPADLPHVEALKLRGLS